MRWQVSAAGQADGPGIPVSGRQGEGQCAGRAGRNSERAGAERTHNAWGDDRLGQRSGAAACDRAIAAIGRRDGINAGSAEAGG